MKNDYPHIFSPLTVKNMTIKNRIVMMPMGTNYGEQNGEMSFLHINYLQTGLIDFRQGGRLTNTSTPFQESP